MALGIDYRNGLPDASTLVAHTMALIGRKHTPAPMLMFSAGERATAGDENAAFRAEYAEIPASMKRGISEEDYVCSRRIEEKLDALPGAQFYVDKYNASKQGK